MHDAEHPPAIPADDAAIGPEPDHNPDQTRAAPDDVGPIAAVDLLIDEARAAVSQEIDLMKALAAAGAQTARNVGIMGVAAVLIALVAMMTLAVGAMFAIAAQLGFGAATAIVVGGLVLMGAILALMMRRQIAHFRDAAQGTHRD